MPAADRRDQLRLRVAPKLFHVEQFWRAESFGDLQIVPRGTIVTSATDDGRVCRLIPLSVICAG
jgi:hypothetical protein